MRTAATDQNGNVDGTTDIDLPEGWAKTRLADIVSKIVDGSHNPAPKQAEGRPMFSARNIGDGTLLLDQGYRLVSEADFKTEDARTQVVPGDVLLTIVGSIGRSLVVPEDTEAFTLQRSVAVMKPVLVDPRFLTYYFRAPTSQDFFETNGAGTAQKGVYLGTLSRMPILLAPLPEQHRIVAKIEELFEHVGFSRHRLDNVQLILKRFRRAVLDAACSGALTDNWRQRRNEKRFDQSDSQAVESTCDDNLPIGWHTVTVGDVADVLGGKRLPKGAPYAKEKTDHPYLRVTDFDDMTVSASDLKYITASTYAAIRRYTISSSDVYISIAGSIGKVGLVPSELNRANLTENAAKLTNLRNVTKEFLAYSLNNTAAQGQIEIFVTSSGQPKLALFRIEKIELKLPPLDEQCEIVRLVSAYFKLADAIEKTVDAAARRVEKLNQTILAKAFRGELVPTEAELARETGREYEPASVLLERILAERRAASG